MKVHELVDWFEKNADPEAEVWVEVGGDGAIHSDTAGGVREGHRKMGVGASLRPTYVISSEPN